MCPNSLQGNTRGSWLVGFKRKLHLKGEVHQQAVLYSMLALVWEVAAFLWSRRRNVWCFKDGVTEEKVLILSCSGVSVRARINTQTFSLLLAWESLHSSLVIFQILFVLRFLSKNLPASFRLWAHKGRFALDICSSLPRLVFCLTLNLSEEPPPSCSLIVNVTSLRRSAFSGWLYLLMFNTGWKYKGPMIHSRSKTCQPTLTYSITLSTLLCSVHSECLLNE